MKGQFGENMKILFVEIDMLNTHYLGTYNNSIPENILDAYFEKTGGTLFKNCYTSGADTPRAHSELWSGVNCFNNGCYTRAHYPAYFLNKKSFLSSLVDNNYKINILSEINVMLLGTFPSDLEYNFIEIKRGEDFSKYSREINAIGDNPEIRELTYVHINEYHEYINSKGANLDSVRKAMTETSFFLENITNYILDKFDLVVFLSDHGHLVQRDFRHSRFMKRSNSLLSKNLLSSKRNRNLLLFRQKDKRLFEISEKLTQIIDVSKTILDLCNINEYSGDGLNLYSNDAHNIIYFEDFFKLYSDFNMTVDIWGFLVYPDEYSTFSKFDNLANIPINYKDTLIKLNSFREFHYLSKVMDEYKIYLNPNFSNSNLYFFSRFYKTSLRKIKNFIHF